jgi:hypothetical protein
VQKVATISLRIEGFTLLENIVIEDIGNFAFTRVSELGKIEGIIAIYAKGNKRVISIETNQKFMNSTCYPAVLG